MQQLRHNNAASLKHYLDVISLVASHTDGDASRCAPAAAFIQQNLWKILGNTFVEWGKLDSLAPHPLPSL